MRVGYCPGVYDRLHSGHRHLLREASKRCDRLIVGVHTDAFVEAYKRRPTQTTELRMRKIRELDDPKLVVVAVGGRHADLVRAHGVTRIFHGSDWELESYKRQIRYHEDGLDTMGVEIVLLPYTRGISTTSILNKKTRDLSDVDTIVFDLDNTLMLGGRALPYARTCVERLRKSGRKVFVVTNNNRRDPDTIDTIVRSEVGEIDGLVTSLHHVRETLRLERRTSGRVVCWGTAAATKWLDVDRDLVDTKSVDVLVLLYRHDYDADDLRNLCTIARNARRIVVGNIDPVYPSADDRTWPDTGSVLALLRATSVDPVDFDRRVVRCGKPHSSMLESVVVSSKATVVVGDREHTDGALARAMGARFVHAGVEISHLGVLLDYVFRDDEAIASTTER